jgi:hypothetical protein
MPPKLILLPKLRLLVIHTLALWAAHDRGIQHPALDGEPAFGQVLPGMPLRDRRPLDAQLAETGG